MVRGALFVMAVALLTALANVQAWTHHLPRSSSRSSHDNRDRSDPSSTVAASIAHEIARSELGSVPIPYTKQFYLTFGPYYVQNPLSDKRQARQFDEIDLSAMGMGG